MIINEGHGVLFATSGQDGDGLNIHEYGILALDAVRNNDLDAFQTITVTETTENVYETVRSLAKRMGLELTEDEFDWMDDRLK
jgi:hypothetical protein